MTRAAIIMLVLFAGFFAYAFGKVAKEADQWEEDWWDKQKDTELYADDDGQTKNR